MAINIDFLLLFALFNCVLFEANKLLNASFEVDLIFCLDFSSLTCIFFYKLQDEAVYCSH